jgi:hypothetical protein
MQITANHKKPGDNTPCTACSRVRTETYVLTLGNVTVCVCDQCWPRMLERVAALGVGDFGSDVLVASEFDEAIEEALNAVEEAENDIRGADMEISRARRRLEKLTA